MPNGVETFEDGALSLAACRNSLGSAGRGLTDSELVSLRSDLYAMAQCVIAAFEQDCVEAREAAQTLASLPRCDGEDVAERAAVLEFDGHLPRGAATRSAIVGYARRRVKDG